MRPFHILIKLVLSTLLLSFVLTANSFAEETKAPVDLQKSFEKIKIEYEKDLKNTDEFAQRLDVIAAKQKEIVALEIKLDECISKNTSALTALKDNLKVFGTGEEAKAEEDRDIQSKRKELNDQIQLIDNELKRCSLSKVQLKEFSGDINSQRLELLKQQVLSKETSVYNVGVALLKLTKEKKQDKPNEDKTDPDSKPIASVLKVLNDSFTWQGSLFTFLGALIGWLWRRKESNAELIPEHNASITFSSIVRGLRRTGTVLGALIFLWLWIRFSSTEDALLPVISFALLLSLAFAIFRGISFPQKSLAKTKKVPRFRLLSLIFLAITFSSFAFLLNQQGLGRYSNSLLLYLLWFGSMVVATVSFILILRFIIFRAAKQSSHIIYLYIPILLMAAMLVAAFLGYRNLASQVFFGILTSMITISLMYLFIRVSSELFDSLDQGKIRWQAKLRKAMSVETGRAFPGVVWLRMLVFFAVMFMGISALITIWGGPQQHISMLKGVLQNGLKVGSSTIDIGNIIFALLIMVVTLSMLPFIKSKLILGWLRHSNLSSGAKDATQTLVGYVVVGVALLSALFILGMNFQNLAIIAGALSVGIGFGLQNIVNNFVSGLILLFERPIRRGDWIVVGTTEGYVKDISIRSTTIQTFDKADVIVPNSELISNQVTNWMLSSNIGRLKAAVGVAYGSDINKVLEILQKIAEDHPEVISHNDAYATRVLFLAFGDSSLNFELRCFVKNVENRMNILSDVNLSIDAAFREHNIEIPFPQRVVHMQKNENELD